MPDLRENNPKIRKIRQILGKRGDKGVTEDEVIAKLEQEFLRSYLKNNTIGKKFKTRFNKVS